MRSVVGTVDVSQCSSSCDEWIDTHHHRTWGHTAKRDDQHTIDYHLHGVQYAKHCGLLAEREGRGRERESLQQ